MPIIRIKCVNISFTRQRDTEKSSKKLKMNQDDYGWQRLKQKENYEL